MRGCKPPPSGARDVGNLPASQKSGMRVQTLGTVRVDVSSPQDILIFSTSVPVTRDKSHAVMQRPRL